MRTRARGSPVAPPPRRRTRRDEVSSDSKGPPPPPKKRKFETESSSDDDFDDDEEDAKAVSDEEEEEEDGESDSDDDAENTHITVDHIGMRGGPVRPLAPPLLAALTVRALADPPMRDASLLCDDLDQVGEAPGEVPSPMTPSRGAGAPL